MKKSLLALAVLGSFAGMAAAQSSVTVFGVVDASARWIKNGGEDRKLLGTDGNSSSRIGFRGIEDLGGGLRAGFWLESAINPDAGTTQTRFWHRRSTVSLIGNFGEIRLGRDLTPTWTAYADFDVFGTVGVADKGRVYVVPSIGGTEVIDTRTRSDNMISYFLPSNLGGLYGQLSVAAGEGATNGRKYIGGRIGYRAGPLDVTGAYQQTEVPASLIGSDEDYKLAVFSGSYDFGVLKLLGTYQEWKLGDFKERDMTLAATVPVGPGTFKASYSKTDGRGSLNRTRDADQFGIGYVYDLSKRTAIYTTYAYIKNKSGANFTAGAGGPPIGFGEKSQGFDLGIRHNF